VAHEWYDTDGTLRRWDDPQPSPQEPGPLVRWLFLGPGEVDEDSDYVVDGIAYRDQATYDRMARRGLAPKAKDTQHHVRFWPHWLNMFDAPDYPSYRRFWASVVGVIAAVGYVLTPSVGRLIGVTVDNSWTHAGLWFLFVLLPGVIVLIGNILPTGKAYYRHGAEAAVLTSLATTAAILGLAHYLSHRTQRRTSQGPLLPDQQAQIHAVERAGDQWTQW